MRVLLLALVVLASVAQAPAHGPYADKPGWVCYRGETVESAKRVHCACKAPCDNEGREDASCQTYCVSKDKCMCHLDECEGHR